MARAANFFDRLGQALVDELHARRLAHAPLHLVCHLESWTDPQPRFEVWPCPANPEAQWGREVLPAEATMTMTLVDVDVASSLVCPEPYYATDTSIGSNFDVTTRFWAETLPGDRAPGLYLPEPGLAHFWPQLREAPNLTLTADYQLSVRLPSMTTDSMVGITFLARFEEEGSTRALNTHLLTLPLPAAWAEGKQFGDAQGRSKTRRHRPVHPATTSPYVVRQLVFSDVPEDRIEE